MARAVNSLLGYLHLDMVITGLVLAFILAGGLASNANLASSTTWALPSQLPVAVPRISGDAQRPIQSLSPTMKSALDYVVQRYRVSADALLPVFETVQTVARERHLDPLLIIAVISIESRFNPYSQSQMGAQGLMQIIPRYHQDKLPDSADDLPFLDPITNVRVGAQILQEAIRRRSGLMEGLQYYAGASEDDEQAYANKVLAEKLRLEQATRRADA